MAEKIRYTRRDLKGPDEFISTFGRIVAWSKENRSTVIYAASGVLAVLVLVVGVRGYLEWQENRAAREIWPALEQARELLARTDVPDQGALASAEDSISSLAKEHAGTSASVFAQYYLGCIAFRRGDYEGSVARFREGIRSGKDEGVMKYLLRKGVGSSLEAKGDLAGAAAAYREAAGFAGPGMKARIQFSEARVLDLSGKKDEAASLYRKIGEENPDSRIKDLAELKLGRM